MPSNWDTYVGPYGVVLQAHKSEGSFHLTRIVNPDPDGNRADPEHDTGEAGDYIVRGMDGHLRAISAEKFEAEFKPCDPPAGMPGVTQVQVGHAAAGSEVHSGNIR